MKVVVKVDSGWRKRNPKFFLNKEKIAEKLDRKLKFECVNEPNLIQVTADDMNKLEMAFGDKAELRKDWLLSV